jgi:hypothetical protein
MKKQLLKYSLPISMGLVLTSMTVFGLLTTSLWSCAKESVCVTGQCMGADGDCYSCAAGSYCTLTPSGNCSSGVNGVYCCTGGGGGCTPTGCPSSSPWLCGGLCYASPPSGNHSCIKCP